MSIWAQINTLPEPYQRQILSFYNQSNFPIEIRSMLAEWIEQQNWSLLNACCNSDCENTTYNDKTIPLFLANFFEQIKQLSPTINDINVKFKLNSFVNNLQSSQNCYETIKCIYQCLQFERRIISQNQEGLNEYNQNNFTELYNGLEQNKEKIMITENLLRKIKSIKEDLNIKSVEYNAYDRKIQETKTSFNSESQEIIAAETKRNNLFKHVNQLWGQYLQQREELMAKHSESIIDLENIYNLLINNELNVWKLKQQSPNNETFDNIVQIKELCEFLACNIWNIWQQLKCMETLNSGSQFKDTFPIEKCKEMKSQIINLLKNLVNATFIIKKQPRQVMKTNTKFTANVSLLVASVLNIHMNPPVVKVSIINENQAKQLYLDRESFRIESCCGEILNNTSVMEYNNTTKQLSANFVNLQLKKIKRTEKKGSESVMDEKFALLFSTEFFIEEDLKFNIKTFSVPVVVIVHGNQEANAQATITWDNAFSVPTRCPFEVPHEVQFGQLAKVLSQKFYEAAQRPLSDENIKFLAGKILGNHDIPDPLNAMVSWSKFSKEHLPGQAFTFWDWYYAILKLTREYLIDVWRDGHIIGFLTRQRAEELLADKLTGTFLLRFSDTKLGGISVTLVGMNELIMVDPYLAKDLFIRKLPDRLHDISELSYLYPNISKDEAFSAYYTKENQTRNGYVRPLLKNYIPCLSNSMDTNSVHSNSTNSQMPLSNNVNVGPIASDVNMSIYDNNPFLGCNSNDTDFDFSFDQDY